MYTSKITINNLALKLILCDLSQNSFHKFTVTVFTIQYNISTRLGQGCSKGNSLRRINGLFGIYKARQC